MKKPFFSIVIPALNEEKYLPNLLESLSQQTWKDFEVIVVDGSSKDKTVDVAKSFKQKLPKLKIIISKKASLPLQRNIGAKAAHGEWFIFIDADSVVMPNFIARIYAYIREKKPGLFTTWVRPDSEHPRDANIALLGNLMLEVALSMHKPLPSGPLTAVLRQAFDKVGGYDEEHAYNEDLDFCLRVEKANFSIHIIPETLYTWSLRRFRQQGTLKVIQQYVISALPVLFFNRPLRKMSGYVMGGQLYTKKKKTITSGTLKRYEKKLKKLLREIFE